MSGSEIPAARRVGRLDPSFPSLVRESHSVSSTPVDAKKVLRAAYPIRRVGRCELPTSAISSSMVPKFTDGGELRARETSVYDSYILPENFFLTTMAESGEDKPAAIPDNDGQHSGTLDIKGIAVKAALFFGGVYLVKRLTKRTTRWDHAKTVSQALAGEKVCGDIDVNKTKIVNVPVLNISKKIFALFLSPYRKNEE